MKIGGKLMQTFDTNRTVEQGAGAAVKTETTDARRHRVRRSTRVGGNPGGNHPKGCGL